MGLGNGHKGQGDRGRGGGAPVALGRGAGSSGAAGEQGWESSCLHSDRMSPSEHNNTQRKMRVGTRDIEASSGSQTFSAVLLGGHTVSSNICLCPGCDAWPTAGLHLGTECSMFVVCSPGSRWPSFAGHLILKE